MRSMAGRWSDEEIAASLNRMGMPTGQGKTWTAHRVSSLRRVRGIHAYRSAEKNGEWLTLSEAAAYLGVSHHQVRRLIKAGILTTEQVMPGATLASPTSTLARASNDPVAIGTADTRSIFPLSLASGADAGAAMERPLGGGA